MITLQWYISRELLKTFSLTAIALTLLFSLGGGVLNMVQVDVLTAVQLGQILGFIVPVAATLTFPVAALFSAAIVYGRFSADNEIDACRSSGINVYWLLTPAVVLAALVFAFTFSFSNFVIPRFAEGLEQLVRADPQKIVAQAMRSRGYLQYTNKYIIYADQFLQDNRPVSERTAAQKQTVEMERAVFIELEQDDLARYGTTPHVMVEFRDDPVTGDPLVEARMLDVRLYDQQRHQFYNLGDQRLGPFNIPWKFRRKIKWMTLPELVYYRLHPAELPEVQEKLPKLRGLMQQYYFYEDLIAGLRGPDKRYYLGNEQRGYEIRAASVAIDPETGRPRLDQPVIRQWWDGLRRTFHAGKCNINVERPMAEQVAQVYLKLDDDVRFYNDDVQPRKEIVRARVELEPAPLSETVLKKASAFSDQDLLDEAKRMEMSPRIDDVRVSVMAGLRMLSRKVLIEMHGRTAFSASVLFLLVMGASLGIVLRGGEMLTAFVVSFLPGLFVTVMIIMGRQMAEKGGTPLVGLGIIWGSLVLVAIADAVVLTRFLRR